MTSQMMIKRAILALSFLGMATVAQAAGTVSGFSLTPQFDASGKVMPGCKLYVYQAGTVATPQNAYQDSGLTITLPNPMTCDASGRLPAFFLADGTIKLRLTKSDGTQVFVGDNLLVIGPSSGGGGGGGSVDPTTVASTGDVKAMYGTGAIAGWVRMNARTIGSATSGASERANADTQALFSYLWNTDASLAVSGGRGASAAADWAANKTITLPDLRGRVLSGTDDMGGLDAARLSSGALAGCRFSLGCAGGENSHTLTLAEIPTGITGAGSNNVIVQSQNGQTGIPTTPTAANISGGLANGTGGTISVPASSAASWAAVNQLSGINTISVTSNNTGGGSHNIMQPTMLTTFYIKL